MGQGEIVKWNGGIGWSWIGLEIYELKRAKWMVMIHWKIKY
jgi:hypothetical protein